MKFFGIGLQKTGTTTLGDYFAACGIRRYYGGDIFLTQCALRSNYGPLQKRIKEYDGFEDAPWFMVYEWLATSLPDAKFILTTRSSPDKWLESCKKHCENYGPTYPFKQAFGYASPIGHETEFLKAYIAHIERVRQFFEPQPDRYLEVCIEDLAAHDNIVHFLGGESDGIPRIWSNRGSGGRVAGSRTFRFRTTIAYHVRCMLEAVNLPVR
jgi:hypothetical protein